MVLLWGPVEWRLSGLDVREKDGAQSLFIPALHLSGSMHEARDKMKDFLPRIYRRIRGIC